MSDQAEKIGTVEILRARIYSLDAESTDNNRSTVIVEPGTYELYRDGMTTYWIMRGKLNRRGIWRMGDGLFGMHGADVPSPIEVVFPSRRFGPDEWEALLTGSEFVEGPEQRLRVTIEHQTGSR